MKLSPSLVEASIISSPMQLSCHNGRPTLDSIHCTFRSHRPKAQRLINNSGKDPKTLETELLQCFKINVVGQIHLFNFFLPLILKGTAKKVIALTSGFADDSLTVTYDLEVAGPYSISKAALNTTIAKYSAELRKDGVLFLSISPGFVETGQNANGKVNLFVFPRPCTNDFAATKEHMQGLGAKFFAYAPHFKGPATAEESVKDMMSVIGNASVEKDAGAFISHHGNKQWI
jgi:NAD(P)-dependent dehydrogenase (short-subunit alcohol dehydrogenase family)